MNNILGRSAHAVSPREQAQSWCYASLTRQTVVLLATLCTLVLLSPTACSWMRHARDTTPAARQLAEVERRQEAPDTANFAICAIVRVASDDPQWVDGRAEDVHEVRHRPAWLLTPVSRSQNSTCASASPSQQLRQSGAQVLIATTAEHLRHSPASVSPVRAVAGAPQSSRRWPHLPHRPSQRREPPGSWPVAVIASHGLYSDRIRGIRPATMTSLCLSLPTFQVLEGA